MKVTARDLARIIREQSDELMRFHALAGVRRALHWRPRWALRPTVWGGLIRVRRSARAPLSPAPLGWIRYRDVDAIGLRATVLEGPVWLMVPLIVKREWRWWWYRAIVALGLWKVDQEAGYYHEGRWRWQRPR